MKFNVTPVLISVCSLSFVATLPTAVVDNLHKNFKVIQGPKEFLVPLDPLKGAIPTFRRADAVGSGRIGGNGMSDLDYLVYGKIYLMKALGMTNQQNQQTEQQQRSISSRFQTMQQYKDNIEFKLSSTKRPYRFWKSNKAPVEKTSPESNGEISTVATRKLEERSAEENLPVASDSLSSDASPITGTNADLPDMDEEGLELIQNFVSNSQSSSKYSPESAAVPAVNTGKTAEGTPELVTRFLISVPNFCPEGQKRTHRGHCKPVFVHNPSPQDGIFAGRITPSTSTTTKATMTTNVDSGGQQKNDKMKPFVSLIKGIMSMEKSIMKATDKLSEMVEHQEVPSSTPKAES